MYVSNKLVKKDSCAKARAHWVNSRYFEKYWKVLHSVLVWSPWHPVKEAPLILVIPAPVCRLDLAHRDTISSDPKLRWHREYNSPQQSLSCWHTAPFSLSLVFHKIKSFLFSTFSITVLSVFSTASVSHCQLRRCPCVFCWKCSSKVSYAEPLHFGGFHVEDYLL